MVGEVDGAVVGLLRWGLFWDQVPFMNLLWVVPKRRGQGIGTALVVAWEKSLRAAGHDLVLTSTMSDERSQHLYRRLGSSTPAHCSCLTKPQSRFRQPLE